jgi:hypothetical protein
MGLGCDERRELFQCHIGKPVSSLHRKPCALLRSRIRPRPGINLRFRIVQSNEMPRLLEAQNVFRDGLAIAKRLAQLTPVTGAV